MRSQLVGFAAVAAGILDWTATLPDDVKLAGFQTPAFRVDSTNLPTNGGKPIDAQEVASRAFLGVVFVVLLFLSVIIYGMWVATGVASEKSSRVMELMISAASPRQLLTGKVVGHRWGGTDAVRGDRGSGAGRGRLPGPDRRGAHGSRLAPPAPRSSG